jgi:hypothetical protein
METARIIAGIIGLIVVLVISRKLNRRYEKIKSSKQILNIKLNKTVQLLNYHKHRMASPCANEKKVMLRADSLEKLMQDADFQFDERTKYMISKIVKELKTFAEIKLGQMDKADFDRRIDNIIDL